MIFNFARYSDDVKLVLITTLLSNIGIFMVIPFLAIYLQALDTVSVAEVGIIIGLAFWCQRAGSFLGGILADYFHVKATMLLGLVIRVPGYAMVGFVENFYLLTLSCCLIGLGSSVYMPAAKSFLVKVSGEAFKVDVLSTRIIFSNIGVAIGPVIGMAVFTISPPFLFTSVALIFILLALLNSRLDGNVNTINPVKVSMRDFLSLASNWNMMVVSLFMFLFMFFYMQLEVTVPMFSSNVLGEGVVGYIFICNALVVIFLQSKISKWTCTARSMLPLSLAFFLFFTSFMLLEFIDKWRLLLFVSVVFFSLAETIVQIRLDYDATNINPRMVATSFGLTSLCGAFGGFLGSYFGTLIYPRGLFGITLWELLAIFSALIATICLVNSIFIKEEEA